MGFFITDAYQLSEYENLELKNLYVSCNSNITCKRLNLYSDEIVRTIETTFYYYIAKGDKNPIQREYFVTTIEDDDLDTNLYTLLYNKYKLKDQFMNKLLNDD